MNENNMLFSREALDKLRSPDRLDKMIMVTTPVGWMMLLAVGVFLMAVLIWSIFGSFTVTVEGMGLIMDAAGTVDISHFSSGKIERLRIKLGQTVHKGELIAQVNQAEKSMETIMARRGVGLATSQREAANSAYQYDQKRQQQIVTENVYSEYDGLVDEILVDEGTILNAGTPICRIRLTEETDELLGILYIPVEKGKRVKTGDIIQLAPNGVDTSESGSLIGVVLSVSQYPLSSQGAQKMMGNDYLAQWIAEQEKSALMAVTFDLVRNDDEVDDSKYLWTSIVGEHPEITPGSFVKGSIVIERKPPIERVFYKISQWLRSR